mmetsp:Transcript_43215/g.84888  ORF Transcript_43215/g.84888 Transcript_43215/m.84888 type:complete len:353 (+) Transcript_43215:42-1100(+)
MASSPSFPASVFPAVDATKGILIGRVCNPSNDLMEQDVGGGHRPIHDENIAASLGFTDGAPIHGTVHFSQLAPLLLEAFGHRWFEEGSISVHFLKPVRHLEPVRAFAEIPRGGQSQIRIWMEKDDGGGTRVFEGTASCGSRAGLAPSTIQRRIASLKTMPLTTELILMRLRPGERSARELGVGIDFGRRIGGLFPHTIEQKNRVITEPSLWYEEGGGSSSPWGRAVLAPELLNAIMFYTYDRVKWQDGSVADNKAVGLFGGCEVNVLDGPLFPGELYDLEREVIGLGETRGTEFVWVHTRLFRQGSDSVVAEMLLQTMALKRSVPGYNKMRKEAEEKRAFKFAEKKKIRSRI